MYDEIVFDMSEGMNHLIPHKVTDKWYEDGSDIATIELDNSYTVSAECISNTPYKNKDTELAIKIRNKLLGSMNKYF